MKATSALVGGFVLGVGEGLTVRNAAAAGNGEFTPNAWLVIRTDETITVIVGKSEMGQGATTGLATLVAEELDAPWHNVSVEVAPAIGAIYGDPQTHQMTTGGSTSMRTGWLPMRTAGASARAMLVAAAAKRWNVDPRECTTKNGRVYHASSHRSATYGSLVADASEQSVPTSVPLKPESEFTLIGSAIPRLDIPGQVDGSTVYGIDVRVPGMRFASIAYCPVFGGSVNSFDAGEATALPGVLRVVEVPSGVAVVATNSWAAFKGKNALAIQWDLGPNAGAGSPAFVEADRKLATSRAGAIVEIDRGNVASVAGRSIEAVYAGPYIAHVAMEPMNAVASWTHDSVEIWAPTQAQTRAQAAVADLTGLPTEKIVLHTTALGGGFGRRLNVDYVVDAVAVSRAIGEPVQVIWTREDDIMHDFYRPMMVNAVRGVLDARGALVGFDHTVVQASGERNVSAGHSMYERSALNGIANMPYGDIPNFRVSYIEAPHGIPVGALRGPNANWNAFVTESFIDELAHAAGRDPLAFRLKLAERDERALAVLRLVAEKAEWGKPRTPGAKHGIALAVWNGSYAAAVAEVTVGGRLPSVARVVIAADVGRVVNPDVLAAQLQGGTIFGLSIATGEKITIDDGRVEQRNFDDYPVLRFADAPEVETYAVASTQPPTGVGEVGALPVAPAVANAFFSLTGKRMRSTPFVDAAIA